MLSRLKITTRMNLALLLGALCIGAGAAIAFAMMHAQMLDERRGQLRNLMDLTLAIARADMKAAGGAESEAGKKAFWTVLRSTRFGDDKDANYVFSYDYEGNTLSHIDPKKLGKNSSRCCIREWREGHSGVR